jgi:hypothetical protein
MHKLLVISAYSLMWTSHGLAAALPDPTRPYQYGAQVEIEQVLDEKVQWRLSGIRINENKRSAILNGKLVKEGDKLDGAVVLEIKPAAVTLQQDDKRLVVRLLLSNIKQPVPSGNSQ